MNEIYKDLEGKSASYDNYLTHGYIHKDEKTGENMLLFEVPGFGKDDIEVKADNGKLIINGELSEDKKKNLGDKTIKFKRDIKDLDAESVKAGLKDGILEIKFKYKGEDSLKKIELE